MRGRTGSAMRGLAPVSACAMLCLSLANCTSSSRVDLRWGVSASERVVQPGEPVPKGGGTYRVGSPYVVGGQTYFPQDDPHYHAEGLASWYGDDFHGRYTANGELFDTNGISAAHPTLPLPSYVRVTNLTNGRSIIVRVNDRGPYVGNRIIDVSTRAANLLGFLRSRHRAGARRICRPGAARRLRRPHPRGDAARARCGAGTVERQAGLDIHHAVAAGAAATGADSKLCQRCDDTMSLRPLAPCRLPRRRTA